MDKTIDYDAANYKVTVSIKEEAGILVATATGDAAIQFKNSYQPLGTEIHLQATKELVGKKLTDQEFTFELVNASNQVIQTAKNDALGQIRFDKLAYTKTGSYDYTIREKAGVDPQITYDTKSYKIHVEVVDQRGIDDEDTGAKLYYTDPHNQKRYDTIGTPKLAVKPDTVKSTRYQIQAEKLLSGRSLLAGEFTFELLDSAGKVIQTVHNDASGKIEFSPITYTSTGDYDYTVRERGGWIRPLTMMLPIIKLLLASRKKQGSLLLQLQEMQRYSLKTVINHLVQKFICKQPKNLSERN